MIPLGDSGLGGGVRSSTIREYVVDAWCGSSGDLPLLDLRRRIRRSSGSTAGPFSGSLPVGWLPAEWYF
jgi:hypothetical protein